MRFEAHTDVTGRIAQGHSFNPHRSPPPPSCRCRHHQGMQTWQAFQKVLAVEPVLAGLAQIEAYMPKHA